MLYHMNLDDRSYREIEEEAVFHIPREYPEWTNYNLSDPGMTLVQLFSWLAEVQQYHLSRPNAWKRRKYLKLLGTEVQHIRPSFGAVSVEPGLEQTGNSVPLLRGTRFYAGDMVFESVEKEWVHAARLIGAYMIQGTTFQSYHNIGNDFEKQMKLYPFGEFPESGNQCCFVLDQALEGGQKVEIYFDICTDYEVKRNPADEFFFPLAELKWEYYGRDGWEEMQVVSDDTCGLVQSGRICFFQQREMAAEPRFQTCQIRVTLEKNDYDVAPLIQNIYLNEIQVRQQCSLCDYETGEINFSGQEDTFFLCSSLDLAERGRTELYLEKGKGWSLLKEIRREKNQDGDVKLWFRKPEWAEGILQYRLAVFEEEMEEKRILGRGDAFANQEYDLHFPDFVYDSFEIMVYDEEEACFISYEKAEDFDSCTPEDRVYLLDIADKRVLFGDCERGMAPDGEIRILRLKCSLGKSGNIKADKIRECGADPGLLVRQYKMTAGGLDEETLDACFERFRLELKKRERGVTYSDYEELVRTTPGLLILDSRVIPPAAWEDTGNILPENQISVVVQPLSFQGRKAVLSASYKQNIRQRLESRKMLGTRIQILNPEYIGISVYAEIVIKPQFPDARGQMEEAVRSYLDEKTWGIGQPVLSSTLYGILDTLPCVWQVKALSVNAIGNGCRHLVNGDVGLPPNGLAYLDDLDFRIYTAD